MLKQLLTVVFLLSAGTLWAQQAAGLLPVQEDTHCKEWVEQTLSRMKLKDKVGQLFVYTLAPRADKDTEKLVAKRPAGDPVRKVYPSYQSGRASPVL